MCFQLVPKSVIVNHVQCRKLPIFVISANSVPFDTYYAKVIKVSKSIYKPIYTQHAQEKYYANVSSATVREAGEQQGCKYAANNEENERNTASQVVLHLSKKQWGVARRRRENRGAEGGRVWGGGVPCRQAERSAEGAIPPRKKFF